MTSKLPPLPAPRYHAGTHKSGPHIYYTPQDVEQIRRDTVMACADLCAQIFAQYGNADACEAAILELLGQTP